ncbi:MAG: endonuclease/exonuclease/phosphatase family protein [Spirochaetales bacterium]|nr:endonuclease/exonuclease/phosphatase family protein [Spirochaetales bacterium]MCF7937017.1 endonuclease/exonuclease/phosphatase family protein [Spirochaetales bacterium]
MRQGKNNPSGLVRIIFPIVLSILFAAVPPNIGAQSRELPVTVDHEISIATFNIRIFSDGSRNEHELSAICDILKHFDLIALQEVRDEQILKRTVAMLKRDYDLGYEYIVSPPVGRGITERYAFLYRDDRIELFRKTYMISDEKDYFIREPYVAGFRAGNFDFFVMTIHIIYGDSIRQRRGEVRLLDLLYKGMLVELEGEKDLLLAGDFNLPPDDEAFTGLDRITDPVNPILPTSIRDRLYDNIRFSPEHTGNAEFTGRWGVYFFDEIEYDNDDRKASLAVSDHRPLWAVFDTRRDDD